MELPCPFIRLPFAFDSQRLAAEVAELDAGTWMAHPGRLAGNSAVPLISRDGADNNHFSGHMALTQHARACEYIQQVMACFGEVLARSRLMRLAAGSEVPRHVDFNYHWYGRVRIHIPITTNPKVIFSCGDQSLNMEAGECWIFDSWRNHRVVNGGVDDRVHLVVDLAGSSRFWREVEAMQAFGIDRTRIAASARVREVPYKQGQAAFIQTERFNLAPVMAPGELEALANELIADCADNPANSRAVVDDYRRLLNDLAKDWRELWHLYGYDEAGVERYQAVLNSAAKRLHPNPRALITQSNEVGINPIIVQRILRAALNIEPAASASP